MSVDLDDNKNSCQYSNPPVRAAMLALGAAVTQSLVRDAQAGHTDALEELLAEHLPLVYNIIGRALAGHPDVDDVVQDTMLRAIRGLPGLREPDRFRSWLIAIAYRQIQLYLRSRRTTQQRRARTPVELAPGLALADPDFADEAAAEIVVADQRRELVEAARWLDDGDRRLLGLWWQEASGELTRGELAATLDVQPKHAAVRVQRMKAQLDAARGVVRALRARPRCPELTEQLRRWNGVADPLWRKRLARHVRGCPACEPRRHGLITPEELLLGMGALPVPAGLLIGLKATPVKLSLFGLLQHKTLTAATATTVALGGGIAYAVYHETLPPGGQTVTVTPTLAPRSAAPGVAGRASPVALRDLIVSPKGSDDGDGSPSRPFATLGKAISVVTAGQTISLRGGIYRLTSPIEIDTSGTAGKPIVLRGYRDERPVLDAAGLPGGKWAITQRASWWTVQGLEIKNSPTHAYVCSSCSHMVFRDLSMHDNGRSGLMLRDSGTAQNQVLNSDFFDNGTGLSVQFGDGSGNLLRGNRSWGNDAAGYDVGGFTSAVTVEYSWAYRNGRSGFVLAGSQSGTPPGHQLRHDVAWDNGSNGFTDDGAGAPVSIVNSTAFRNAAAGFAFPNGSPLLRSDVAVDNKTPARLSATAEESRNDWAATFRSTDPASAEGPRRDDGTLPRTDFLVTGNGTGASMGG